MKFIRGFKPTHLSKSLSINFIHKTNFSIGLNYIKLQKNYYFSQAKVVSQQSQTLQQAAPYQSLNEQKAITKNHFEVYPVQKYEVGQRLDRYLKNENVNWAIAQKYLRQKQIYILTQNGQKVKDHKYRLQQGDKMYVRSRIAKEMFENKQVFTNQVTYEYAKQKLDDLVIFDNKNITVLNKPPNYSVQGGDNIDRNLFSLMAARYKRQMVHVIHRLDKPTTGVLLFCKNLRTAQLIQAAIESRKDYNKFYLALSIGQKIPKPEEYIRCNIEWTNKHKARIIQSLEKQESKDSITYYKKLYSKELNATGQSLNLLGLKLITGRKHQIRCHLTDYLNNPILNDRKYGAVILNRNDQKTQTSQDQTIENEQKLQYGYIYLHALMTTIKSNEIATNVFEIPEDKLIKSKNSDSLEVIESTSNGSILLNNGKLKIIGSLPKHWKKMTTEPHQSTNHPNLKQIVLDYPLNEIQMGGLIEKSQENLWKKHQPRKKVITIQ